MYNEIMKGQVIFGYVTECAPGNELKVQLDNGEWGVVPADQITFRDFRETPDMNWRVGRRFGFIACERREDGLWLLSGRAYEQANYEKVKADFDSRRRNVYLGKFRGVNREGDLAFYELAYGVNGCMRLTDFCQVHFGSFRDIELPRYLPVAVRNISGKDRISITGKIAFGDFEYGTDTLDIDIASEVRAYVMPRVAAGCERLMCIAPNLLIKCDRVPAAGAATVVITDIDEDNRQLHGTITEDLPTDSRFDFGKWVRPIEQLGDWVDMAEFEKHLNASRREKETRERPKMPSMLPDDIEISYELTAVNSPFEVRGGEQVIHEPFRGGKPYAIAIEVNNGCLHEYHTKVAEAVNTLKYTTTYQLQRYLHMKEGLKLSEAKLRRIINRLVRHDILGVIHFRTEDKRAIFDTLHPGIQFRSFMGQNPRFPVFEYNQQDAAVIKSRLAANQLLLGVMHGWEGIAEHEAFPNLALDDGLRVRPRHKITMSDGRVYYLDAVRDNRFENMCGKLQRYDKYFAATGEKVELVVVMETEAAMEAFAEMLPSLGLGYDISLTCDLKCLPVPVLRRIPAKNDAHRKKGLFSRVLSLIGC